MIDPTFDWEDDDVVRPRRPWHETVIYEVHVKGFTKLHSGVREDLRGTYGGLACEPAIAYLQSLGVTAVELLPVHHIADEGFLHDRGLTNYWGYSTIGYLAPHSLLRRDRHDQVREFKGMVKALHRAGIEVILDVVYNHTAEGNHLGPMLRFKGVDNQSYYRLVPETPRFYMDYTGTGNTLNPVHPSVLRLIMDSLRYFVIECHVDGFRFDLASALAREFYDVDRLSAFFDIIHQDPVLSQVKLIAEPWDVGPGGYQVGNFPILWSEWNGIYRDTMRDFWRGAGVGRRLRVALRRLGRPLRDRRPAAVRVDQLRHRPRRLHAARPRLLQREAQRGERRGEPGRHRRQPLAGTAASRGRPTTRPCIALRARQQRNFLATLLLSQGVPMLLGGDESGRTQGGNNNAWCQDNEISWFDWEHADGELLEFTRRLIALRRAHPVFRRTRFFEGTGEQLPDVWWMRPDGRRMTRRDWDNDGVARDRRVPERRRARQRDAARRGAARRLVPAPLQRALRGDRVRLPARRFGTRWELELVDGRAPRATGSCRARDVVVESRSIAVFAVADVTELRATYRLQLTPEFGFAEARAARAVPARSRHLAPLSLAVAAGARRLAARVRRRRPPPHLGRARRRGGVPRARRRRASA